MLRENFISFEPHFQVMAFDIIIGRNESDRKKFGDKGVVFLGKAFVKMGRTTSLSNRIFVDVVRSHVILVAGKRGGGKSYSLGVLSEGMSNLPEEVSSNIAVVIFDTMGIYWTMKHANLKDEDLLKEWGIKPEALSTVKIYTPKGYYQEYLEKKLPTDAPFSIRPSELTAEDWVLTFEIRPSDPVSILIEKIIYEFHEKNIENYSIDDIIIAIENDKETDQNTKNAAKNRFRAAKGWGLFDADAEKIQSIVKGGQVTVVDVSVYSTSEGGWGVKNLVVGLIAKKLFIQRMVARKLEEVEMMEKGFSYLGFEEEKENKYPMVWLILDEAHEALPQHGKTAATDPLVTILREGRQPGVSLILATQQPGMIHHDVITQTDIVLSHRLTAKTDIEALNSMMQSYMLTGITQYMNELPRDKGSAIILDDTSERIYPLKVRPRISWHGGEAPTALKQRRKLDLS